MTQPFLITVELPDSSPRSIRSNVRRPVVRILVPIVKLRQGESHKNFNLKPLSEDWRTQGGLGGIGLGISLNLRRLSTRATLLPFATPCLKSNTEVAILVLVQPSESQAC